MGMNQTPSGDRIHISFFGRRNAGKSSLVNGITRQALSVVSEVKGTTTDPVYKTMELLPLGPVMIVDTPGFDDEGALGELRVQKTRQVLHKTDIAILVVDGTLGIQEEEQKLLAQWGERDIPYLVAWNKSDLLSEKDRERMETERILVSAKEGQGIEELKEAIIKKASVMKEELPLLKDLLQPLDLVVLVVPIDEAAPKGRLILPQQQVLRDILDAGAVSVVVKDTELAYTLEKIGDATDMVITDSQVFHQVSRLVPEQVKLTSFSILMARKKGFLKAAVSGVMALDSLEDGDRILIAEGCTHHRQCGDIGTEKLPEWIRTYTGKCVEFLHSTGTEFPEQLTGCKLVIHCGGCMLKEKEVIHRMRTVQNQGIPFTNYGTVIAYMNGILQRSISAIPEVAHLLQ